MIMHDGVTCLRVHLTLSSFAAFFISHEIYSRLYWEMYREVFVVNNNETFWKHEMPLSRLSKVGGDRGVHKKQIASYILGLIMLSSLGQQKSIKQWIIVKVMKEVKWNIYNKIWNCTYKADLKYWVTQTIKCL